MDILSAGANRNCAGITIYKYNGSEKFCLNSSGQYVMNAAEDAAPTVFYLYKVTRR